MAHFLIKPGSVAVIIISLALVGGMYYGVADNLLETKEESFKQQDQSIDCSYVSIDFVSQESNDTHTTVYIQSNTALEALAVEFEATENRTVTKNIQNMDTNELQRVTANIAPVNDIAAYVKGCDRTFG